MRFKFYRVVSLCLGSTGISDRCLGVYELSGIAVRSDRTGSATQGTNLIMNSLNGGLVSFVGSDREKLGKSISPFTGSVIATYGLQERGDILSELALLAEEC